MNFSFSEVKTSFDNRSVFLDKTNNNTANHNSLTHNNDSNTKIGKNFVALE